MNARSRDGDYFFSAWLWLIAFLPRLYVAIAWAREPVWDGHYYDFGARRIAAGFGYSDGAGGYHPWCHWPVGYSGLLAGNYVLFGYGPHVATILNAVTGALVAVFTHRLARYELSPARARIAGLLVAFYPGLVAYSALLMTEPLSALVLVLSGWLWIRFREERPNMGAALFGIAIGAGTLVHPSLLLFAPTPLLLAPPSAPAHRRRLARALSAGAIATACAFAPILPWTIRNCMVMDRCALVSTNGGWNLAIGSFARATGRFETLRASDGCAVVTGQVQQDACWRDFALHEIRRDPIRWVSLVPKKLGFTFDQESFPIEYLHEADPERWPEVRREKGRAWLTTASRLLMTIAWLGVIPLDLTRRGRFARALVTLAAGAIAMLCWVRDDSPFYLLACVIASLCWVPAPLGPGSGPVTRWASICLLGTILTHAVFFGEDRYHFLITPMLCILAAGALRHHGQSTYHVSPEPASRTAALE